MISVVNLGSPTEAYALRTVSSLCVGRGDRVGLEARLQKTALSLGENRTHQGREAKSLRLPHSLFAR